MSTQAMTSALLFESRSIILATVWHYWKYILWLKNNLVTWSVALVDFITYLVTIILYKIQYW